MLGHLAIEGCSMWPSIARPLRIAALLFDPHQAPHLSAAPPVYRRIVVFDLNAFWTGENLKAPIVLCCYLLRISVKNSNQKRSSLAASDQSFGA